MIYFNQIMLEANSSMTTALETPEALAMGLKVLLLGMATVFAVLALLWFILLLFKVIFYHDNKAPKEVKEKQAPVIQPAPEPEPVAENGDDSLIAAIVAAISAYTAEDNSFPAGFKVVSFRRAEPASPWNRKYK